LQLNCLPAVPAVSCCELLSLQDRCPLPLLPTPPTHRLPICCSPSARLSHWQCSSHRQCPPAVIPLQAELCRWGQVWAHCIYAYTGRQSGLPPAIDQLLTPEEARGLRASAKARHYAQMRLRTILAHTSEGLTDAQVRTCLPDRRWVQGGARPNMPGRCCLLIAAGEPNRFTSPHPHPEPCRTGR